MMIPGVILATVAGCSTMAGGLVVFFVKEPGQRFLGACLGFSAGIMVAVSFIELLPASIQSASLFLGSEPFGLLAASLAFFIGIGVAMGLDFILPHTYKSEVHTGHLQRFIPSTTNDMTLNSGLYRVGAFTAIGIFLHNLPEGIVTLAGTIESLNLGILLFFAIAVHNIPEGLSVAVPIYASTGSTKKAFMWSFLPGLAEPVGAIVAALILLPILIAANPLVSLSLAFVAGIMVFISIDELLPTARECGAEHMTASSFVLGMLVMVLSLVFFSLLGA